MPGPRRTLRRLERPDHARFLTFSCYRRLPLFQNDRIKDAFADAITAAQADAPFILFAWVIMPEHIHLLLRPGHGQSVQTILRRLKPAFARRTLDRWRQLDAPILQRLCDKAGRHRFWQPGGGYDRNLFTRPAFDEAVRYTHYNPVTRGLVTVATDYRWSSAARHAVLTTQGPTLGSIHL